MSDAIVLPPDDHAHSQWSHDARRQGDMERTCERALRIGLRSIAFTEHVDFTSWESAEGLSADYTSLTIDRPRIAPFDVAGYLESLQRCRDRFPELRIRSGVETGEPHLFGAGVAKVLAQGDFERVLGSLHAIPLDGRLTYAERAVATLGPDVVLRRYFAELLNLVERGEHFTVLAHMDYPRRAWPRGHRAPAFVFGDFEEEYRTVLRALAASGRVLEFNTKGPLFSVQLLRWWREAGGRAISFGSDAHEPLAIGRNFREAVEIATAAGFRPDDDPLDFWLA